MNVFPIAKGGTELLVNFNERTCYGPNRGKGFVLALNEEFSTGTNSNYMKLKLFPRFIYNK